MDVNPDINRQSLDIGKNNVFNFFAEDEDNYEILNNYNDDSNNFLS